MCTKHQDLSFQNSFITQRQVNGHLVTVEVGIESGTSQRVQTDSLSFDQFRLKGLNTQTVKGRSTVQQYRMTFQYVFQNIPNHRITTVYDFLGTLHGLHDTPFDQLPDDKRHI